MPSKKDAPAGEGDSKHALAGFDEKEKTLLAAAFLSSIGHDKYDFEHMASITSYTAGTLKKFWPQVKKKAIENVPSFATFMGSSATAGAAGAAGAIGAAAIGVKNGNAPKANRSRKRKEVVDAEEDDENDNGAKNATTDPAEAADKGVKGKAGKPRSRPAKKVKVEPESGEEAAAQEPVKIRGATKNVPKAKQDDDDEEQI